MARDDAKASSRKSAKAREQAAPSGASVAEAQAKGTAGNAGAPSAREAAGSTGLPAHLELQRTRMICGPDLNLHTSSSLASHQYLASGPGSAFDLARFKAGLRIEVASLNRDEMTFHLRGASPAIANALRRVIIAETPTVAIEHVFVVNNTSVIPDEVLSHRLGLVPLHADPRRFDYRGAEEAPSERNTIVFRLRARCRRQPDGAVADDRVYSRDLVWLPSGSELPEETGCRFVREQQPQPREDEDAEEEGSKGASGKDAGEGAGEDDARRSTTPEASGWRRGGEGGLGPVHEDILLARLRPGQEIELEAHAVKGVGEDHAKFSPVATAWYRLMPEFVLLRQVSGQEARELASELPGLVELVDEAPPGPADAGEGPFARIAEDVLAHDRLLEKVRRLSGEDRWAGAIQLRKVKDHFIFTIESTGAWRPQDAFRHAVRVLESKCDKVLEGLQSFPNRSY